MASALGALLMLMLIVATSQAQTLTTLVTFNVTNGQQPSGLMQAKSGSFYGTTSYGGANGDGEVFVMTSAGALNNNFTVSM
jgi:uncharacterized repeat protein (TIGR03803 family)